MTISINAKFDTISIAASIVLSSDGLFQTAEIGNKSVWLIDTQSISHLTSTKIDTYFNEVNSIS